MHFRDERSPLPKCIEHKEAFMNLLWRTLILAGCAAAAGMGTSAVKAQTPQRTVLTGHLQDVVPSLQPLGRLDGSTRLRLSINLPLRNRAGWRISSRRFTTRRAGSTTITLRRRNSPPGSALPRRITRRSSPGRKAAVSPSRRGIPAGRCWKSARRWRTSSAPCRWRCGLTRTRRRRARFIPRTPSRRSKRASRFYG